MRSHALRFHPPGIKQWGDNVRIVERWKAGTRHTRHLKREVRTLALAARDPRTPWYAKLLAVGVVAYVLSLLDLIPDPILVLGYLDELALVTKMRQTDKLFRRVAPVGTAGTNLEPWAKCTARLLGLHDPADPTSFTERPCGLILT